MIFFRIISILFLGWIIGLAWFINQVESTQSKNLEKSDAIVVLTGSKGRIDAGIELLLEKKANYLFVSGVGQKAPLDDLSQYLSSFNPKQIEPLKSSIFLGHFASSTEENALETAYWVKQHHYKKIILVTSNYHMPRSLFLLRKAMPDVEIVPYQVVKNKKYWKNIPTLKLILLEYNKLLFLYFSGYLPL
jgi:uncharacterized SAM-binding protein YcdF (DUF218 family)